MGFEVDVYDRDRGWNNSCVIRNGFADKERYIEFVRCRNYIEQRFAGCTGLVRRSQSKVRPL
jgi:hypothetical protein